MKVTLIDSMGDDLSVVNAARVSFNKKSWWVNEEDWLEFGDDLKLSDGDIRLIHYLAKHNHWTPFGHTAITLHIKAPIFVARQLGKHQVGFVWNEVSRRYVTSAPEFFTPQEFRRAAENVKQGSSEETTKWGTAEHTHLCNTALDLYKDLLEEGVCPEQARMVLPQSMYIEWYWTGNLYSFYNVWKLRTDSHTQRETQEVAKQIGDILVSLYPVSWKALTDE